MVSRTRPPAFFNTGPLGQDTRSQDTWVVVVAVGIRILVIVVVVLVVVVVEDRVRVDTTVAAVLDDTSVVGEAVAGMLAVAVAGSLLVTDRAAADIAAVVGVAVEHILLHSTAVGDDWVDRPEPTTDWVWEEQRPYHDQNDCDRPTSRLPRPPNVLPPPGVVTPAWMWASYWWNNLEEGGE